MCIVLEEQIAVVNDVSFLVEFLEETTCSLHSLLLELLLNHLLVELSTLTLTLLHNLEEVSATVTLDDCLAEGTLLADCHCTRQSGLAGTCSLNEDRSREGHLIDRPWLQRYRPHQPT